MLIQIKKSQLVYLDVPANAASQQRFNFLDQPQLRNAQIDAIETYTNAAVLFTPMGVPVVSPIQLGYSYLTMFIQDADKKQPGKPNSGVQTMGEYINQIPLVSLNRTIQSGGSVPVASVWDMLSFPSLNTDWSKSYVTTAAGLGNSSPVAFLFNVYYRISS